MTLATRCPQCGTTFRVVSDQLKLRKGLVKCGKCLHVFNGVEFLHYFSEPVATSADGNEDGGASTSMPAVVTSAPTPEFLGVDDPHVPNVAATRADIAAAPIPAAISPTAISPAATDPPAATDAPVESPMPQDATPAPAPADENSAAIRPEIAQPTTPLPATERSSTKSAEPRRAWYNLSPPEPRAATPSPLDPAPSSTAAITPTARVEDRAMRDRWIATPSSDTPVDSPRADRSTPIPTAPTDVPAPDEELVATAIEPLNGDADEETRAREEVARIRTAQAADDEAAALSPLTLVDVARQSAEPAADTFEELPAFLRERRRTPRWVRALIMLLVLASALTLMAQAIYAYRAEVAAEFPDLRTPIAAACSALPLNLNCEVGLPQHITQLRVTGADLQPADAGSFNLMVTIHNDASVALAYPALDVILTDVRNQVLVRRVVVADEYLGAHRDAADRRHVGLAPNAETAVTVPMRILDETVVGYTVGIFYP